MINSDSELPKVLGVGNALVDVMIKLPGDDYLKEAGLAKGAMTLVDSSRSSAIYEATAPYRQEVTTGGSAANTIHALAMLGGNCGYAGKIGNDDLGRVFREEFDKLKITAHLSVSDLDTGRVMALVTPDSERTMATYLGAAADLTPAEFTPDLMEGYDFLYVEGYLVQNHELIETIVKTGYESGLRVALDLSSYNIVADNLEFLKYLVEDYVDVVFANEEEALAFAGEEPFGAVKTLAGPCRLAVVKLGRNGSIVRCGNKQEMIAPVPTIASDTTGAGDSYAAGFLYGLTKGLTLQECGNIASLVSSKAVENLGAKIPEAAWPYILKAISGKGI